MKIEFRGCQGSKIHRYRTRGAGMVSHLREAGQKLEDRPLGASCKAIEMLLSDELTLSGQVLRTWRGVFQTKVWFNHSPPKPWILPERALGAINTDGARDRP